jgi:hypothetical protein
MGGEVGKAVELIVLFCSYRFLIKYETEWKQCHAHACASVGVRRGRRNDST